MWERTVRSTTLVAAFACTTGANSPTTLHLDAFELACSDGSAWIDSVPGPGDNKKAAPGVCGCGVADTDTDGDTIADCVDDCVNVPSINQANCSIGQPGDNGGDARDGLGECCGDDVHPLRFAPSGRSGR